MLFLRQHVSARAVVAATSIFNVICCVGCYSGTSSSAMLMFFTAAAAAVAAIAGWPPAMLSTGHSLSCTASQVVLLRISSRARACFAWNCGKVGVSAYSSTAFHKGGL